MKNIWAFFLFIFLAKYCYGKYSGRWVLTRDEALIDESLKKALRHVHTGQDQGELLLKVSNVVCKKKLFNGINIKLYFDIDQERWKCLLYKPVVYTLGIQFEKCTQINGENSSDETQIAQENLNVQEKSGAISDENIQENDDDAKVDELREQIPRKNDNFVRDEFKEQITRHDDEVKIQHNIEQNPGQATTQDETNSAENKNNENIVRDQVEADKTKIIEDEEQDDENNNEQPKIEQDDNNKKPDEGAVNEVPRENEKADQAQDNKDSDEEQDDEEADEKQNDEETDEKQNDEILPNKDSANPDTNIQNDDPQKTSENIDKKNNYVVLSENEDNEQPAESEDNANNNAEVSGGKET